LIANEIVTAYRHGQHHARFAIAKRNKQEGPRIGAFLPSLGWTFDALSNELPAY